MALSASTRNAQIIRFNFATDEANLGGAGFNYTINRTLALIDATAIFSTSAVGQSLVVRKAAATCVTITTNNVANEVRQANTLDLANAYFSAGDVMNFLASNNVIRGLCHVHVLPGTTASS